MHMLNVSTLWRQNIKLLNQNCGKSWSAHEGTIYAYTKAILGKIVEVLMAVTLSFFLTKLNHTYVKCVDIVQYMQSIKSLHQKLW